MTENRLQEQLRFIAEIDRLKKIERQTLLLDRSRRENDAEHSWHIAVMTLLLAEHANRQSLDLFRIVRMQLIHDIVEIDAGDTYAYDSSGRLDQAEREQRAADRLFGLLPEDQAAEFRTLWDEFEARVTPEAQFAAAMDRLQPLLHNLLTEGLQWKRHGITLSQVVERCRPIEDGSERLWQEMEKMLEQAVREQLLEDSP